MQEKKDIKAEFSKYERYIISKIRSFLAADGNYKDVCIVGGWVRDKLLGFTSKDLDISFRSQDENRFLNDLLLAFTPQEIILQNDEQVSIVLQKPPFYIEQEPLRGFRVNVVEMADASRAHKYKLDMRALKGDSIESDFFSRDFTLNAMYYDILKDEIRDPGHVELQGKTGLAKENTEDSLWCPADI